MRPAWRLGIKSLWQRRLRTGLLIATVALSAALITAVTCALESANQTVAAQVEATVGSFDAQIRASGKGGVFDDAVVEKVRGWDEVASAVGTLKTAVTLSAVRPALQRPERLTADDTKSVTEVDATGSPEADAAAPYVKVDKRLIANVQASARGDNRLPVRILEGRAPAANDEVVLDILAARRLTWKSWRNREQPEEDEDESRFSFRRRPREFLTGAAPSIPGTVATREAAEALNVLVGVRVGEEVTVVRQALPPLPVSAIVSNPKRALRLAAAAGSTFQFPGLKGMFRKPTSLKVVGIADAPPLVGRPTVYMTLGGLGEIMSDATPTGMPPANTDSTPSPNVVATAGGGDGGATPASLTELGITLRPGVDPALFVERRKAELPAGLLLQTSGKITAGLDRNVESSRLGVVLATVMAFLAASFIIMTGMTTSVTERTREMGVLRAIGATRWQLSESQLAGGAAIGVLGAVAGLPLGVLIGAGLVALLRTQLEIALVIPWWGLVLAGGGAVVAGVLGAAFPAWQASRVSPLEALASRSKTPGRAGIVATSVIGATLALAQLLIITLPEDGQTVFWAYATVGLPALFCGYFLLSVGVTIVITRVAGRGVEMMLGLPRRLMVRTVLATPYRHGFTAGAMMGGLALMVAIWTQGGAVRRDWLEKIEFPDAFVTGLNLSEQSREAMLKLPSVEAATAIAIKPVETDAFGVRALQQYKTSFMAFEPRAFFAMTKVQWVQGDPATAIDRLEQGGAVIVAREFLAARGLGVGDMFKCRSDGKEFEFEIVGVVTSPGLEMVSKFFNVGEDFTDQALHAVFGSRKDLKEKFGSDSIHLFQVALRPDADDTVAVREIRRALFGAGILDVGSGRRVKQQILKFVGGGLLAASTVGIAAMLVASFGVANLIVAGIQARKFEFGVLRAVGASRGQVARLVLGEAVIVALAAAVLGTAMGLQGALAGKRLDQALMGIQVQFRPPVDAIAGGWLVVAILTLGAALPAVVALARREPRELLGAVKG